MNKLDRVKQTEYYCDMCGYMGRDYAKLSDFELEELIDEIEWRQCEDITINHGWTLQNKLWVCFFTVVLGVSVVCCPFLHHILNMHTIEYGEAGVVFMLFLLNSINTILSTYMITLILHRVRRRRTGGIN